jgi:hypothetical protein
MASGGTMAREYSAHDPRRSALKRLILRPARGALPGCPARPLLPLASRALSHATSHQVALGLNRTTDRSNGSNRGVDAVAPTVDAVAPTVDAVAPTVRAVAPTVDAVAPTVDAVAPTVDAVAPPAGALAHT